MVRSPSQKRIASALLLSTIAVQLHVSGAWTALQSIPAFSPFISVQEADAQAATRSFTTNDQLRTFVGNTAGGTAVDGITSIRNDAATAQKICTMAGYNTVSSRSCTDTDGRCNYTSCGDNFHQLWNGSSWSRVGACGGQWLAQLTCSDPINVGGGAQCQDGIDNDGDGKIDALVTGTNGGGAGGGGGNFSQEGADPKYNKTWITTITCRNPSTGTNATFGNGDAQQMAQLVSLYIRNKGLNLTQPQQAIVRSDGGSNWDAPGTFHTPTLNAVCQIFGDYNWTYVSSTCRDNERSGLYPTGKCNFHSPGDNNMHRFSGTLATPTGCSDGIDNDGDGQTDLNDSGCASANDLSEIMHDPQCTGPTDTTESDAACSDGVDNDGDGLRDFPQDPGCVSAADNDEFNASQCQDGIDNDGDGATDFPADFSCTSATDNDETNAKAACQDGVDNDGDGKTDFPLDPGCASNQDNDELNAGGNPINVTCPNGQAPQFVGYKLTDAFANQSIARGATFDTKSVTIPVNPNDRFFLVSYPVGGTPSYHYTDDEVLLSTGFAGVTILANYSRGAQCIAEVKSDPLEITGLFQGPLNANYQPRTLVGSFRDICGSFASHTAYYVHVARCSTQCSDGIDNDGDGATDFPNDFSCTSATDNDETNAKAACQDGVDNDGDGKTDFPLDPGCVSAQDNDEFNQITQCNDGIDNDGDGYADLADAACTDVTDNDEGNDATCQSITAPTSVVAGQPFDAVAAFRNNTPKTWIATAANAGNGFKLGTHDARWTPTRFVLPGNVGSNQTVTVNFRPTAPTTPGTYPFTWFILEEGKGALPQSCTRTITVTAPLAQCQDGIDNDGDGATDFPADFSCTSPTDNDETNQKAACQDRLDNDNDGRADFPQDPGCASAQDNDEFNQLPQCQDGIDNDGDGATDFPNDFSCSSPTDNDETNAKAACQDGVDNDNDGRTDFPQDPGCASAQDNDEFNVATPQCQDGIDNDGDGRTDYPLDPGCDSATDTTEGNDPACGDRIDNDGDNLIDFPNDPGCASLRDTDESNVATPQCQDGIDNDGDGATDFPADFSCSSPTDTDETNPKAMCQDGVDNDGDGRTDFPLDPGCVSAQDNDEFNAPLGACRDGLDNDGDGRIDLQDPGCSNADDTNEGDEAACQDRRDNDFDGLVDFPFDPGCSSPTDNDETNQVQTVDLSIVKSGPTSVVRGQTIYYTIQVGNGGTTQATNVTITDNVPSGLAFNDGQSYGPCAVSNNVVTCALGTLAAGQFGSFLIAFDTQTVPNCTQTSVINSATISGTETDSNPNNNTSSTHNAPTRIDCPALNQCQDGQDNDFDGRIDFPADPGCSSPTDTNEGDDPACADRRDNDGDGLIDFPNDPGCASLADTDESNVVLTQCNDGQDNDFDGRIDFPADPGCSSPTDTNEGDEAVCQDRRDNDGDGLTDWPLDPGCSSPTDTDEYNAPLTQCSDGIDNDGDWRVDMQDPGCSSPQDNNEGDDPACSDRIDNDNDGRVDFPLDPGCVSATDTDETDPFVAQCSDGRDNDFDGRIDFPADPGCQNATDNDESNDPTQYGCIEVMKETFDPHGTPLPIAAQFTFILDATRVAYNDASGRARFEQVLPGSHGVAEIIPSGWTQLSVSPTGGTVNVVAGSTCAQVTFRNRQVFVANAQCADGFDNDGDGLTDYPQDSGCSSATDNDEYNATFVPQCRDGIDNDADGLIDYPADPGCQNGDDNNEQNQTTTYACSDNVDNDNDGLTDYPQDSGCSSATDTDESNGAATYACNDNVDNDNDGLKDYPADPGCSSATDTDEFNFRAARCSDGIDNDADGLIDYPQDTGCTTAYDDNEYNDRLWIDRWKEFWNWNW